MYLLRTFTATRSIRLNRIKLSALFCAAITLCACQPIVNYEIVRGSGKGSVQASVNTGLGSGLLSGFYFRFSLDDHPLQTISVRPLSGSMEVTFADRDPTSTDDEYIYEHRYEHIKHRGIIEKTGSLAICHSHCPIIDTQLQDCESRGECVFVLRGFKFVYARDDFAVKKFAILENNGAIDVELHDRSGQNQFAVTVDYALVPKALIQLSETVEGEGKHGADQEPRLGVGTLSGFSMEFLDDDFRIMELGAHILDPSAFGQPGTGYVGVKFTDRSKDKRFKYKVAYNIMNVRRP